MKKHREAPFDRRLMCSVESVAYDFVKREGALHMAEGNCCDCTGCLALFRAIDPKVRLIRTFAGGKPDTLYRKGKGREWVTLACETP